MLKEMVVPKKVIVFNPNTQKRETWTWIQFQKHIAEFTMMFEDAGVDLNDLSDQSASEILEEQTKPRAKYDH